MVTAWPFVAAGAIVSRTWLPVTVGLETVALVEPTMTAKSLIAGIDDVSSGSENVIVSVEPLIVRPVTLGTTVSGVVFVTDWFESAADWLPTPSLTGFEPGGV